MKGTVYVNRRPGCLGAATLATAREVESEQWWADCLRDGGVVIEIEFEDIGWDGVPENRAYAARVVRAHRGERQR